MTLEHGATTRRPASSGGIAAHVCNVGRSGSDQGLVVSFEIGPATDRPDPDSSLQLTPTRPAVLSDPLSIVGGGNYLLSGWCRSTDTVAPCIARLRQLDAGGELVDESQFIQWFRPREWLRAERVVSLDSRTTHIRIEFRGLESNAGPTQRVDVSGLRLTPTDAETVEQILDAYLSAPTPTPPKHPWMIYRPDEVPELRERCSLGPGLVIWRHLLAQCEKHYTRQRLVDPPRPVRRGDPGFHWAYSDPEVGHYVDSMWATRLTPMYSLAAAVTRRQRYIDKALEWLLRPVDWPAWCVYDDPERSGMPWDLCVGKKLGEMGLGYDMMHDHLTASQRDGLVEKLAFHANFLLDACYRPKMRYGQGELHSPHTPLVVACLGLCGLALLGDHPDAAGWLQFARFFFKEIGLAGGDHLYDDGGYELGYYEYGAWIGSTCAFSHCLRRLNGEDLFALRAMRQTAFYLLYGYLPPDRTLAFGASDPAGIYYDLRHSMAALGRHQQLPEARWFVAGHAPTTIAPDAQCYPDLGNELDLGFIEHGGPCWMFLWAGEPVADEAQPDGAATTDASTPIAGPRLPPARVFPDTGQAILRSGWARDNLVLALKCGGRWNRDRDNNQLVLDGFGAPLILSRSLRDDDTRDADVYRIDGAGQSEHSKTRIGWVGTPGGQIRRSFFSGTVDYIVADARYSYFVGGRNLRAAERHVVYLRPDSFVIRDRLAIAQDKPVRIDLLLHPGAPCVRRGNVLRIQRERGRAWLTFLSPEDLVIEDGPPCVIHSRENRCEVGFVWTIATAGTEQTPAACHRVETESVLGAQVADDVVLWPTRAGRCEMESIAFDAELVVVRGDGSWVVVSGRYLEVARSVKLDQAEPTTRTGR